MTANPRILSAASSRSRRPFAQSSLLRPLMIPSMGWPLPARMCRRCDVWQMSAFPWRPGTLQWWVGVYLYIQYMNVYDIVCIYIYIYMYRIFVYRYNYIIIYTIYTYYIYISFIYVYTKKLCDLFTAHTRCLEGTELWLPQITATGNGTNGRGSRSSTVGDW